jgi:hypothetical protein
MVMLKRAPEKAALNCSQLVLVARRNTMFYRSSWLNSAPFGSDPFCKLYLCASGPAGEGAVPRKRRFFLAGVPVQVVQGDNNRQAVFFDDSDYRVYVDWLSRAAGEHRCLIHA